MIYKDEDEMKIKLQDELKTARKNVIKDRIYLFFKKVLSVFIIFGTIALLIILRNKYGPLNIKSTSFSLISFEKPYTPLYKITIDDNIINYDYNHDKEYTLIPYFIYFHNIDLSNNRTNNKLNSISSLNIEASICKTKDSYGKYVESCYYSDPIYEKVDINIESISISKEDNIIYSGSYDSNLNKYIKNKGLYNIIVVSTYDKVTTTIKFDLEV